jgi:hypothetical protein
MGDMCDNDAECCSGMACVEEMCTATEGGGGGGGGGDFKSHFRMSVTGGTGAGLVAGGAEEPYNQVSLGDLKIATGFAFSKFHIRANPMFNLPPVEGLAIGIMFRGDLPFEAYQDPAAVSKDRPKPLVLEPSISAMVSYRLVGADDDTGFQLLFIGGIGWMNFLSKVEYKDCNGVPAEGDGEIENEDGDVVFEYKEDELVCDPDTVDEYYKWSGSKGRVTHFFRKAGPVGVELGLDGYYWFIDNLGINFGLNVDVLFPNFLLNIDIQAGLAFQF